MIKIIDHKEIDFIMWSWYQFDTINLVQFYEVYSIVLIQYYWMIQFESEPVLMDFSNHTWNKFRTTVRNYINF